MALLSVFNLLATADVSGAVYLLATADFPTSMGLSTTAGIFGAGDLAATDVVAETEGLSAIYGFLINMGFSLTLLLGL